jgi:hypothetical protein
LLELGAPLELIREGQRIVDDELVHSELSHAVHRSAGGSENPKLPRETLSLPRREDLSLELNLVHVAVEMFCLGETVAVRLFSEMRTGCEHPEAKAALDRILKDEVRHRDFGWALLDWFWSLPFQREAAALVQRELPGMFGRLQRNYRYERLDDETARSPEDAHWGLMPPGHYARALEETFRRDYQPRLKSYEIDAATAWAEAS